TRASRSGTASAAISQTSAMLKVRGTAAIGSPCRPPGCCLVGGGSAGQARRRLSTVSRRRVLRVLVEPGADLAPEQLHRLDDDLGRQRVRGGAEGQLVEAQVDPPLLRAGAVVGVADGDEALGGEALDLLGRGLGDLLRPR